MPPPSSLTTPPATTTAPTVSRDYVDLTDENAYPEDRYYLNPAAYHQGRGQEQFESRGGTETAITTSTWELVTAEQNLAYSYEAPDVDMDILLEALGPDPASEASTTFSPTFPLEDRRPQPTIPLEDRRAQPQPPVATEEPARTTATPEQPWIGAPATSSTTTTSSVPPLPNSTRRPCAHSRTTTVGSWKQPALLRAQVRRVWGNSGAHQEANNTYYKYPLGTGNRTMPAPPGALEGQQWLRAGEDVCRLWAPRSFSH